MKVVITGGRGFLGQRLANHLLERGELTTPSGSSAPIESIVLVDSVPAASDQLLRDRRIDHVVGDVADQDLLRRVIDEADTSVFHLASMVSAECETDFDAAYRVNLGGAIAVLEVCRALGSCPRVVFSSSIAAYGGVGVVGVASDTTKLTPETTYGTTKAISELLMNDYTRKGFVDGRSARLPTVVIRPGRPNAAASSWVSGIFREPLNGEACVIPVDWTCRVPISGYRTIVENLVRLHEVDPRRLGSDRGLNLPALAVTAADMRDVLVESADRSLGPITVETDESIERIFRTWAEESSFDQALALGLSADESLAAVIREYIDDYLAPGT